jgi:hypothetical protein
MKPLLNNVLRFGMTLILLACFGITYGQVDNDSYVTISGVAKDLNTHQKIVFASVSVPGTDIGTVTNSEGEFTLKVKKSLSAQFFEISHLGYVNKKFEINSSVGNDKVFYLEQHIFPLKELTVRPKEPRDIVSAALKNTRLNYSERPNMMTGFYRESIKQGHDYLSISEAVVDIAKAPYTNMQNDQVKIFKGRKGTNVKKADTLAVKLLGGPNVALMLDIIKNNDLIISLDSLDNYNYELTSIVNIDDKPNYVISFSPAVIKSYPLFNGKLYITTDNLAVTMAEFSLDLSDAQKAARQFVRVKPAGLVFLPTATSYLVTYRQQGPKFYLNYVRIELKFKSDWKRKLFKNNYTIMSEIAITDRHEDNVTRFPNPELFKSNMILADKIQAFTDGDFWGDYNIIQPEESIQNAIKRIQKRLSR